MMKAVPHYTWTGQRLAEHCGLFGQTMNIVMPGET